MYHSISVCTYACIIVLRISATPRYVRTVHNHACQLEDFYQVVLATVIPTPVRVHAQNNCMVQSRGW